jgi:hypothetical protein
MSDTPARSSIPATHAVRVAVYDSEAKVFVTEVTLPPGSAVIVGSDTGCTAPMTVGLMVDREELVTADGQLKFTSGMKLQLTGDDAAGEGSVESFKGDAEELVQKGITSPTPVRWLKMSIRIRPSIAVFITYLPAAP